MLHVANSACLDEVARVSVSNSEEPNREDGGGGEEPPTKHQRAGDSQYI